MVSFFVLTKMFYLSLPCSATKDTLAGARYWFMSSEMCVRVPAWVETQLQPTPNACSGGKSSKDDIFSIFFPSPFSDVRNKQEYKCHCFFFSFSFKPFLIYLRTTLLVHMTVHLSF